MTSPARRTEVPELRAGDRLTRAEFHRRYEAMPWVKKAELIEGVVYMPSPARHRHHGRPHARLMGWLVHYEAHTTGVEASDNATVLLDSTNEPQPDALLRILPELGGQSGDDPGGYIEAAPEFLAEVTASRASYDLHDKMEAYRRNRACEYLVWRVDDRAIDWFALRARRYVALAPHADGLLKSAAFPGLWLDAEALLRGDLRAVLAALDRGLASPEHAAFVRRLRRARP